MILYHGSYMEASKPDIRHSRPRVDFGQGFYTTPLREQAEKWCTKFTRFGKPGIVTNMLDDTVFDTCEVLRFDSYSEQWLDFVMNCRSGNDKSNYDIVLGGVANDKVFNTVELYLDHLIDKTEAIRRLRYEKPNLQICFRNQNVMDQYLRFEESWQL